MIVHMLADCLEEFERKIMHHINHAGSSLIYAYPWAYQFCSSQYRGATLQ